MRTLNFEANSNQVVEIIAYSKNLIYFTIEDFSGFLAKGQDQLIQYIECNKYFESDLISLERIKKFLGKL